MSQPGEKPLLSILVPAFACSDGVRRILAHPQLLSHEDCELIIYDNSSGDDIDKIVQWWKNDVEARVTYKHNRPSLGAAANWNALLDAARGEHCLLMHDDEFPLGENFVEHLIAALREDPDIDVFLLDCVLCSPINGYNRRHLPMWLRSVVINRFPQYLFRRNVIGPTATLVVRRSLYPRFDVQLRWLLDVDLYVRLLKVAKRLKFCPKIQVGSTLGRPDSITASLGSSIPEIEREEQAYLRDIHHTDSLWLGPFSNESISRPVMRACENACWKLMRIFARLLAFLSVGTVSRAAVKQVMRTSPEP